MDDYSPSDCLVEDVLIVIFKLFSEKDLQNCEAVCQRWRQIIQSMYPWRANLRQQVGSSSLWRASCKKLALNFNMKILCPAHYRNAYLAVLACVQQVDRNWHHGNYKKSIYRNFGNPKENSISMSEDYVLYRLSRPPCDVKVVDRRSMEIIQSISPQFTQAIYGYKNTLIFWDNNGNIGIYEIIAGRLERKLEHKLELENGTFKCCSGTGILAACSSDLHQLTVWRMKDFKDSTQLIPVKPWTFPFRIFNFKVDDLFIYVEVKMMDSSSLARRAIHFISSETLEDHRSMAIRHERFLYDGGLLLMERNKQIRILDVKSGTYLRDLPVPWEPFQLTQNNIKINSKCLIIKKKIDQFESEIFIYDLESFKNPDADNLRFYKIEILFGIHEMLADELQIVCLGKDDYSEKKIMVLDFGKY